MTKPLDRTVPSRVAPLIGGLLAFAALVGCVQPSQMPAAQSRQLQAEYSRIQGTSLESEQERLRLLKSMCDGTSSNEAFVAQTLGAQDEASAKPPAAGSSPKLALWSEFLPFDKVIEQLPALKARGLSLLIAVTPEKAQDPKLLELLGAAKAQGIDVRPWLLVSAEHGYWANKWNHQEVSRFVKEFVGMLSAHDLRPSTITLDVEPPVSLTEPLAELLGHVDVLGARRLLVKSSQNGSLREAQKAYQQLVTDLHAQGVRVHAVTTPMLLDDMAVGKGRLQSALGIPIDGVAWVEVTFMVYRTEFLKLVGPVGGDIVYRYAQDAKRFFGPRAGLDIGTIGSPGFGSPAMGYTQPADLATDLNAASQAGMPRVNIFSLDGMIEQGGVDRWVSAPANKPVKREVKALFTRALIQTVARSLPQAE